METDKRIDDYIAKAAPFAQPILRHIRATVHASVPGLVETVKWSMPHFMHNGKNLAGMAAFKAHCAMMIHGEGRQGDAMGQFGKIAALADLPGDNELKSKLVAARERIDREGTALKKKPTGKKVAKPELAVPPEFAIALDSSPAAKSALEAFAPSHRREYVEWVADAKRPETRDKRIAKAIAQLSEGKKLNWKYENC
ncbi:MAG: YdeI/OmpD-associated family protein [Novosphingobium sp.]